MRPASGPPERAATGAVTKVYPIRLEYIRNLVAAATLAEGRRFIRGVVHPDGSDLWLIRQMLHALV